MKNIKPILVVRLAFYLMENEREALLESFEQIAEDYHVLLLEDMEIDKDMELEILSVEEMTHVKKAEIIAKIDKYMKHLENSGRES